MTICQFLSENDDCYPMQLTTASETPTPRKCHLCKTADFAAKFEQLVWTILRVCVCMTQGSF